jgi:predicted TIM-barrel fold metal-dependent hydrolase
MIRVILLTPAVALLALAGIYLLTPQVSLDIPPPSQRYLDTDAGFLCIGAGNSGCFVDEDLQSSYKFRMYLRTYGVTLQQLKRQGDELVARRMNAALAGSRYVRSAIVLAHDGVVSSGEMDRSATKIYVPNEFVARMARKYPHLEYGASVHPDRADWRRRLVQARDDGAVLVKWVPAAMHIDPSDLHYVPYYRTLMELHLPLMVRLGDGGSTGEGEAALGDPRKLALPLTEGVTVIATNIAAGENYDGEPTYRRVLEMIDEYPNLYLNIAGLTRFTKVGYLTRALKAPGVKNRILYGSDWPMLFFPLTSPFYHWPDIDLARAKTIQNIDNAWDRDVALKTALGVPPSAFQRSSELLMR